MRSKAVLATLGYLILIFSFMFIVPLITGLIYNEDPGFLASAFIVPMLISICLGFIFWFNNRQYAEDLRERESFVVVGLGWLLIAALGALPYLLGGTLSSPIDAYFESMSGFTTTGATILDPTLGDYIDIYPRSILMWRAITTWLGGMGIIVLSVVILARFMNAGLTLFKAEVAGASVTRLRPKLHQTARLLWGVYGLFTILSIILMMGAGMPAFDSVCTSFSTLSTGGFSVHSDNIGFYDSPAIEMVVMFFMIIGCTNFVLHYRFITGKFRAIIEDSEFKFFFIWLTVITLFAVAGLMLSGQFGIAESFRAGIFQAVSAGTTSGFSTESDLDLWPPFVHMLLVLLMLVGATLGSTSGGLKISRIIILLKKIQSGIQKAIHPRSVVSVKVDGKTVPDKVIEKIQILFLTYILTLGIAIVIICATGVGIVDSLSATASCLSNSGLGIFGPGEGFHTLNPIAKFVLIVCMWMGRLEIFTALIVLAPSTYKR